MKRKIYLPLLVSITFLLIGGVNALAQKNPAWTVYANRTASYPQDVYAIGFASEAYNGSESKADFQQRLRNFARTQLIESIYVSIKSLTNTSVVNEDKQSGISFRQSSVSMSKINISGLTEDSYYDEKEKTGYAIAYAKKIDISKLYHATIQNGKANLEKNHKAAEEFIKNNDRQAALKAYFECYPIFREIEEAQTLIIAFEGVPTDSPELLGAEIEKLKQSTAKGLKDLQNGKQLTLDDVAYFMAVGIKLQYTDDKQIRLSHFSFQDTKMASAFSKRLTSSLEEKMVKQGLNVTEAASSFADNKKDDIKIIMTGTYWENPDNLKLVAILRDVATGKALASVEALLPLEWINSNSIKYKPDNYNKAMENLNEFSKNELVGDGLAIDVTTNKGDDNLIFTENDTMKLYIKVNKPCYVRFVYYLADGNKVLLLDNQYIDQGKVNKVYQIPYSFVCAEPFGVENLVLNAQSIEFKPLNVRTEGGYKFIEDDIKKIISATRGFKVVDKNDAVAEKRLTITTLSKNSGY